MAYARGRIRPLVIALLLALVAPAATVYSAEPASVLDIVLSEIEKRIIKDYYDASSTGRANDKEDGAKKKKGKGGTMPPGLAKRSDLPPGLARQLERNGTLPPGLAKRDLPAELESRLPKRSSSQRRVVIDRDVVLIEEASGLVLDVLKDVLTKTTQ
jgi:hypothetical protein